MKIISIISASARARAMHVYICLVLVVLLVLVAGRPRSKILSTLILAILGALASGFNIISKSIKIHQNFPKSNKINEH